MSLKGLTPYALTDFGGAWTDLDAPDVPLSKGRFARNIDYKNGYIGTRMGFSQAFNAAGFMSSMFNWRCPFGNLLVWHDPTALNTGSIRYVDLSSPSPTTLFATQLGGAYASFGDAGSRLYVSAYTASGNGALGAGHGYVVSNHSYSGPASFKGDKIVPPPLSYTPSAPTEPSAGVITAGVHKVVYRIEYRSGFYGKLCPVNASTEVLTPISFTATGSKNASITLNTTWPDGAVRVWLAMTVIDNPAQYIPIPGASAAVVGGTLQSVAITWNITDEDLIQTGKDWTFAQFLWTQTIAGVAPFNPWANVVLGDRMAFLTKISDGLGNAVCVAVVSNRDAMQEFSTDLNLVYYSGRQDFVTARQMRGSIYFFGPNGTGVTSDNGSDPVSWAPVEKLDPTRGTLSVTGVELAPNGNFIWVADESGLFAFNGAYADFPMSYYQSDIWRRINWGAAQAVQVQCTATSVWVLAPLDGSTVPTHVLRWQWATGADPAQMTPGDLDFDLVDYVDFFPGAICIVQNGLPSMHANVQKRFELWVGPGNFGNLLSDPSFERDLWTNNPGAMWSAAVDGANARTGTRVAKRIGDGATGQTGFIETYQQFLAQEGKAFLFSCWTKGTGGADGNTGLGIDFYTAAGAYISSLTISSASAGTSYSYFWHHGIAPGTAAFGKGQVFASNLAGTVWIDDVEVRPCGVLREASIFDTYPSRDNGSPILAEYETALFPPNASGNGIITHHANSYRTFGTGQLLPVARGLDARKASVIRAVDLTNVPGLEYLRKFSLKSEGCGIRLSNNMVRDGSFESGLWTLSGNWSIQTDEANAAEGSTKILRHVGSGVANDNAVENWGNPTVTAGDTVFVTAKVKNSTVFDGRVMLVIRFLYSDLTQVDQFYLVVPPSTTYQVASRMVVAPAGSAYVQLLVYITGDKTTGTHYVDSVAMLKQDVNWNVSALTHYVAPYISSR